MEVFEMVPPPSSREKVLWKATTLSPTRGRILPNAGRIQLAGKEAYFASFPGKGTVNKRSRLRAQSCFRVFLSSYSSDMRKRQQDRSEVLEQLYTTFTACREPGWDGYSAAPISYDAYIKAKQFVDTWPANLPLPEVSADPDGEVSLEWYRSPKRVFSVSIGPNDEITYAGICDRNKAHGTETFQTQIPKVVLEHVSRVMA